MNIDDGAAYYLLMPTDLLRAYSCRVHHYLQCYESPSTMAKFSLRTLFLLGLVALTFSLGMVWAQVDDDAERTPGDADDDSSSSDEGFSLDPITGDDGEFYEVQEIGERL